MAEKTVKCLKLKTDKPPVGNLSNWKKAKKHREENQDQGKADKKESWFLIGWGLKEELRRRVC